MHIISVIIEGHFLLYHLVYPCVTFVLTIIHLLVSCSIIIIGYYTIYNIMLYIHTCTYIPVVAKLVFTKCISKDIQQVVYDYEFIEDYTEPLETETERTHHTSGSNQLLLPTSERSRETMEDNDCKRPLLKSTEYSPLNHPLTLMVG